MNDNQKRRLARGFNELNKVTKEMSAELQNAPMVDPEAAAVSTIVHGLSMVNIGLMYLKVNVEQKALKKKGPNKLGNFKKKLGQSWEKVRD